MSSDILNITPDPEPDVQCNMLRDASRLHLINGAKYFHMAIRRRHSFYRSVIYLDVIPGPSLVFIYLHVVQRSRIHCCRVVGDGQGDHFTNGKKFFKV